MPASPQPITLARLAMATRFELALHGEHPAALRAAGEAALDEVERLEARLSLFRPDSEIAQLNATAHQGPVRVSPEVFRLLQQARALWRETGGAFDVTVAPLMRAWGFHGGKGRLPDPRALAEARANLGMHWVELDEAQYTVRFARAGVLLDLGAIGKGYAVDQAVSLLREAGVTSGLVHGGTSTIAALGRPPEAAGWNIALEVPPAQTSDRPRPLAVVSLVDAALSVSAIWGKSFHVGEKTYGHIMDPRTGQPAAQAILAAVMLPSATETDALSTALLTLGRAGHKSLNGLRPGLRSLVVEQENGSDRLRTDALGLTLAAAALS